jgi:hypothetical protein
MAPPLSIKGRRSYYIVVATIRFRARIDTPCFCGFHPCCRSQPVESTTRISFASRHAGCQGAQAGHPSIHPTIADERPSTTLERAESQPSTSALCSVLWSTCPRDSEIAHMETHVQRRTGARSLSVFLSIFVARHECKCANGQTPSPSLPWATATDCILRQIKKIHRGSHTPSTCKCV